jgi:L-lactate dehydrogenase (cytochrome)
MAAATIRELQLQAKRRVPRMFYDYVDAGSWSEFTYRANEDDFKKIIFRQKVARELSNRSTRVSMLGQEVAMPVALAPTGFTGMMR